METIVLCYKRVPKDLSSGLIALSFEGTSTVIDAFESIDFPDMLKRFAKALIEHPEAQGAIQRIDRPGLVPMMLAVDELRLFREDPAEAIRQRTFSPQVVHVGVEKTKPDEVNVMPPLVAGYEARAECFGELIFVRARGMELECPCCGAWAAVSELTDKIAFRCECGASVTVADWQPEERWAGIRTYDLLAVASDQYFLPRRWNVHGKWITHTQLGEMFSNYIKEKEEWHNTR